MVKVMFSWKDRSDRTAEECEAHYRAVHMGLARAAFDGVEGFRRLVFNRVRSARVNDYNHPVSQPAEPDFDSFVELWFDSQELLVEAMGTPPLDAMFEDHVNFMETDIPANIRIYEIDEAVILAADQD
ncbi:MAG TPA: EthD family reductase [Acidimicrobiales bacterium]|jgi:uncharacterized protein (TIGR02118 family)|nr:EthD family reductase [Acidimicrobiales bacterium]